MGNGGGGAASSADRGSAIEAFRDAIDAFAALDGQDISKSRKPGHSDDVATDDDEIQKTRLRRTREISSGKS